MCLPYDHIFIVFTVLEFYFWFTHIYKIGDNDLFFCLFFSTWHGDNHRQVISLSKAKWTWNSPGDDH